MKSIIEIVKKKWLSIIVFYSSIYVFFITSIFAMGTWNLLLKPGYMNQRASLLYNYPLEQIFVLIIMFIICFFPIIVVLSLLVILKKLIKVEKIILNDR